MIEHNQPAPAEAGRIKTADWIVDLGPGAEGVAKPQRGVRGGEIVAQGTPEDVAQVPGNFTGGYLKPVLSNAFR